MALNSSFSVRNFLKLFCFILFCFLVVRFLQNRIYLSDLKVYYGAFHKLSSLSLDSALFGTDVLRQGSHNPYDYYYGLPSGYYKYAPFFLLLFAPIGIVPWGALTFVYPLISIFVFYFAFKIIADLLILISSELSSQKKHVLTCALVVSVLLQSHNIYRELMLGNINFFLLLFLSLAVRAFLLEKKFSFGFFMALLVCIKPHFIFLAFLPLFYRRFSPFFLTGCFSVALIFSPVLFVGTTEFVELMNGWVRAMKLHNNPAQYFLNPLNIQFMLGHIYSFFSRGFLLGSSLVINSVILAPPACVFAALLFKKKNLLSLEGFVANSFLLAAFIPFTLLVDTNQLLYACPFLIVLLVKAIDCWRNTRRTFFLSAVQIALIFSGIFVVLTQQIPRDWFPLNQWMGFAYLLFFCVCYFLAEREWT